ncbi:MAG: hypothetical protein WD717_06540 [Nitrosarchaeum sp.]
MTRPSKSSSDDYRKVIETVRDYIFENHKFPQMTDIMRITCILRARCNEVIDTLVNQKQLYVAFDGDGLPKIVLLYDMMQGVLMTQKKPDWVGSYGFTEKNTISKQIEDLQKTIIKYEQFERLLYATDIPLEDSIAFALNWLCFENVVHHKDNKDNPDVTFEFEGKKGLLEAEGTSKAGSKDKISQLSGWMQKEIDTGAKASDLKGFFAVNHYRDIEPSEREYPLTEKAKEYLKIYHYVFFTTKLLFDLVKQVSEGKISKEDARKIIWNGEVIE